MGCVIVEVLKKQNWKPYRSAGEQELNSAILMRSMKIKEMNLEDRSTWTSKNARSMLVGGRHTVFGLFVPNLEFVPEL